MRQILFLFLFGFITGSEALASSSLSRQEYCSAAHDLSSFQKMAYDRKTHLQFNNDGGLFDGGVCWWHSLFQRSALYLTVFRPELHKPSENQVIGIIFNIVNRIKVVEIPGYSDFNSFSHDWHDLIQTTLDAWQGIDGFIKQEWIRNISKRPWTDAADLSKRMDKLFYETQSLHQMPWVMLKFPGFDAHAWIVVSGMATANGYKFDVIDSNYAEQISTFEYSRGTQSVSSLYGNTVPYIGHQGDFDSYKTAVKSYCRGIH